MFKLGFSLPARRRLYLDQFSHLPSGWVTASLVCAFAASSAAIDWPRWRGTDFNGISHETAWSTAWPADGPKPLWKTSVGTGFSSLAISGGRLYTLGNQNGTESIRHSEFGFPMRIFRTHCWFASQ